jgi:hypothetical protein
VLAVSSVATVSAMHEQVHEGTKKERQPDEHAKDMGTVLGEKEHPGNYHEADQYETGSRGQKASARLVSIV